MVFRRVVLPALSRPRRRMEYSGDWEGGVSGWGRGGGGWGCGSRW